MNDIHLLFARPSYLVEKDTLISKHSTALCLFHIPKRMLDILSFLWQWKHFHQVTLFSIATSAVSNRPDSPTLGAAHLLHTSSFRNKHTVFHFCNSMYYDQLAEFDGDRSDEIWNHPPKRFGFPTGIASPAPSSQHLLLS